MSNILVDTIHLPHTKSPPISAETAGQPVRVDLLVIYDLTKLKAVRITHTHEGYPVTKRDGFVFREPAKKNEAVLGIFKILG